MKPCKVCALPAGALAFVDAGLFEGRSARAIAQGLVGITRKDVQKRAARCPNTKAPAREPEEVAMR